MLRTIIVTVLMASCASGQTAIRLNALEYFEAPGFSFHPYQNDYRGGHQSGLQMIQNGERLLDSGDLFVDSGDGGRGAAPKFLRREIDRAANTATVYAESEEIGGYRLVVQGDGEKVRVTLRLDKPVDWTKVRQAGFRIALYSGAYYGKSFQSEAGSGVFPQQYTGNAQLLGPGRRIRVAQEEPQIAFTVARDGGTMVLQDNRRGGPSPWFSIQAPLTRGSTDTEVRVEITPAIDAKWRKAPVIGVSQVGYLPAQPKRVVLELDPRDDNKGEVRILRLTLDGTPAVAAAGAPKPWGRFLRQQYAVFDFSAVREPGVYVAEFRGQTAGPFRIAPDAYATAWPPAVTYFLPVQMCHVMVKEGTRTWHGACHLDDAIQAPAGKRHVDSYVQAESGAPVADYQRIPGLDYGGWHDAGDLDLPSGSVARTTIALALAHEEFRPAIDDYTYRKADKLIELHKPDGRDDILQQVEFGAESLLASFKPVGYVIAGIIENSGAQYSHLGDPVNVTDNKPCPAPGPTCDDRWAFTSRNTGLQYMAAQTLAISSRVLKGFSPGVAAESLAAAKKLWADEQARTPSYAPSAYVPRDSGFRTQEIDATAELLLATGEEQYRAKLLALRPEIEKMPAQMFGQGPGWTLARVLDKVNDSGFRSLVAARAKEFAALQREMTATNPYGVPFSKVTGTYEGSRTVVVWGEGWTFQTAGMNNWFYRKHLPDLFTPALTLSVVDYILGVHPASNETYISGVGAKSPLIAYGINRADWSHIPGGSMAGASLIRPDFFEMKKFPFLWYQTEYVIHGSATFVFNLLAAEALSRGQ